MKKIQFVVGIGLSVICGILLVRWVDSEAIGNILLTANLPAVLFTATSIVIFMVCRALRWHYLLQNRSTNLQVFHIQNIGYMSSQFLPFRLGDVIRGVLIGRQPHLTIPQGISTMVIERVLDMLIILLILPLTLLTVPTLPEWMRHGVQLTALLTVLLLASLIFAANHRRTVERWLRQLPYVSRLAPMIDEGLAGLHQLTHWRSALTLVGLSMLVWLPIIGAYYAIITALHVNSTFALAGFVACAGALSMAAPASPGQVGVFHAGVTAALVIAGVDETDAVSIALLYHGLNFTIMIVLGLIGLWATNLSFGSVVRAAHTLQVQK